jgi:hypothetical protein
VEALHDLIRYSELCAKEYMFQENREHPKKKEFGQRYSEAYCRIQKATDIGAFVISGKAATILARLRNKPNLDWHENPAWEIYEADCNHYREALAQMTECARRDLKV